MRCPVAKAGVAGRMASAAVAVVARTAAAVFIWSPRAFYFGLRAAADGELWPPVQPRWAISACSAVCDEQQHSEVYNNSRRRHGKAGSTPIFTGYVTISHGSARHDHLADTLPAASVPGRGTRTAGLRCLTSGWRSFGRISPTTAAGLHRERLWGEHGAGASAASQ